MSERMLRLSDGRDLCYAEYGDPSGMPILFFHGTPGSRVLGRALCEQARRLGVRLIAPDRPGLGRSSYQSRRQLLDWPADVRELADAEELDSFAVLGFSGGGPYVAACAYAIPDRLHAAGIVAGVAPPELWGGAIGLRLRSRLSIALLRRLPWSVRIALWLSQVVSRPLLRGVLTLSMPDLPLAANATLVDPTLADVLTENTREAFFAGTRGVVHETLLLTRSWGFDASEVSVPIRLWQGEADTSVPPAMARRQARAYPNCRLMLYPDEGHRSALLVHADSILRALLG